jgi:hypothetical protein
VSTEFSMNSREMIKSDDFLVANLRKQEHLGEPGLHASIILNEILKLDFISTNI